MVQIHSALVIDDNSDALNLVDFNFSVLRDSGGDLQEYALLIISLRLYHALWPEPRATSAT